VPVANQFTWTYKELIALMIKAAGIHEGRWTVLHNYGFVPGNFGPSNDQMSPGVIVALTAIGIQREVPGAVPPSSLVVDAAEVNPADAPTTTAGGQVSLPSEPVSAAQPTPPTGSRSAPRARRRLLKLNPRLTP
jgi:hypothetical protein